MKEGDFIGKFDKNGKEVRIGHIIDLHQTVNGVNLFEVAHNEDMGGIILFYFAKGIRHEYQYSVDEIFEPCKYNGEVDFEIVGTVETMAKILMQHREVPGFKMVREAEDGYMYQSKSRGLVIIQSINKEQDGHLWIHTSFSRKSRIPSYDDIQFVKKNFIGEKEKAIMVFPKEEEHVNIHPFCLHLWHCEEDYLPDFTNGKGSI